MLEAAQEDTIQAYEDGELDEDSDSSDRDKDSDDEDAQEERSRRDREFPTLDTFLISEEAKSRTEDTLFQHFAEILRVLTSDFYHNTLPTLLAPQTLFLPEKLSFIAWNDCLVEDANPNLVFSPEGFRTKVSAKLIIARYPQPQRHGSVDNFDMDDVARDVPLLTMRGR